MGNSFYKESQMKFGVLEGEMVMHSGMIRGLTEVLQKHVGKELMRNKAVHKVLLDKGIITDEEVVKALDDLTKQAQEDFKKFQDEQKAAMEAKMAPKEEVKTEPTVVPVEETK